MTPAKILVVEDERLVALSMQRKLESMGYSVPNTVATGEEAIQQSSQLKPDLILMDIMLAGHLDGIAAANAIRQRFNIPIIYLTAYSDDDTLQRARVTEPFGYLLKPFEGKELQTAIEMALYKHRMERRLRENEQWLSTVLNSIGDAVIATDENAQVTFMNPMAETLTGWTQAEAMEQPLTEVFIIMDEANNQPMVSLVETLMASPQMLRLGDAMLMGRDGVERPIEQTIASIQPENGRASGIVLIFRDITDRKLVEAEVKHYQENLENLVADRTSALEALNTQLHQEIAEREVAQEIMTYQAEQLLQSNAELEQFAYVASHDLREPLRKVQSYTELLAKRYQGKLDERADKYIYYIVDGADRMQQLITDLLTYSRLGRSELSLEEVDVTAVLQKTLHDLEVAISESQATVTWDTLPTLSVDAAQLARVWQNLITNALKFHTERSPQVHISAQQAGDEWHFQVADNGIGIEEQFLERVFLIFQRLHTRGEYSGTGMGLAICKKIVENHNGRIWATSTPGQGATFHFTLPAKTESN